MAPARSARLGASTSLPPARRSALSKAFRPPSMTTSFFRPVVSGSCQILSGSVPAITAATAVDMAAAAPEVTMPNSAPEISASRLPAACCNSNMSTN